jgi:hypothetical protein
VTDPHARFWSVIDRAHRSADALRPLLEAMSREEMIELWRDYHMLSSELLQPPWVTRRSDFQEELTWWVVAQGKAFYDDVDAHPDKFPKEQGPQGRRFTGTIASVYAERFDEEIMEADARDD